jgi:hypothetical protein
MARRFELVSVQCPSCGADLPPSRPCGSYVCAYCGSRFAVAQVRAAKSVQGQPVDLDQLVRDVQPAVAGVAVAFTIAGIVVSLMVGGIVMAIAFSTRDTVVVAEPSTPSASTRSPPRPSSSGQAASKKDDAPAVAEDPEPPREPPPPPERISISTPSREIPGFFGSGNDALVILRMRRLHPEESLLVDAYRLGDGERVWRFDTGADWNGRGAVGYAIEGSRVLVSDHRAQVHVLDGASGETIRTVTLSDQVDGFCRSGGASFVRSTDLKAWRFDGAGDELVLQEGRVPPDCARHRDAKETIPDHLFARDVRLARPKREKIDGSDTRWVRRFEHRERGRLWEHEAVWWFGQRDPGTPIPRVARVDPKTEQIVWITDVPDGSLLEVGTDRGGAVSDGTRIYVMYAGRGRDWHLAAIDGEDGGRSWSKELPDAITFLGFEVLAAIEDTVVLVAERRLTAYDAATGAERWSMSR